MKSDLGFTPNWKRSLTLRSNIDIFILFQVFRLIHFRLHQPHKMLSCLTITITTNTNIIRRPLQWPNECENEKPLPTLSWTAPPQDSCTPPHHHPVCRQLKQLIVPHHLQHLLITRRCWPPPVEQQRCIVRLRCQWLPTMTTSPFTIRISTIAEFLLRLRRQRTTLDWVCHINPHQDLLSFRWHPIQLSLPFHHRQ